MKKFMELDHWNEMGTIEKFYTSFLFGVVISVVIGAASIVIWVVWYILNLFAETFGISVFEPILSVFGLVGGLTLIGYIAAAIARR